MIQKRAQTTHFSLKQHTCILPCLQVPFIGRKIDQLQNYSNASFHLRINHLIIIILHFPTSSRHQLLWFYLNANFLGKKLYYIISSLSLAHLRIGKFYYNFIITESDAAFNFSGLRWKCKMALDGIRLIRMSYIVAKTIT